MSVSQDSRRKNRDELIELLQASKAKRGRAPGQEAFCKDANVKLSEIRYWWASYGEFVVSAGLEPNEFQSRAEDSEIFENYAKACHHLRQIANSASLRIAQRELGIARKNIIHPAGVFGFQQDFRKWLLTGSEKFKDILDFSGWFVPKDRDDAEPQIQRDSPVFSLRPFLPACLQTLEVLSYGEAPEGEGDTPNIALLFERRVADAFRCLGFEVTQLGQGAGRKADALAYARRERFAVIIDAKVRASGYVLGTEDRKFLDYATTHSREIKNQGIENIYFVVVANSFRDSDLGKLSNFVSDSALRGVTLLTVMSLLKWVEQSIRERHRFQLADLEQKFFGNKIINE
jgi:hypothetical protein